MILQNAHDGSRAYRIDAGFYRLVCRNGLTVADADFAHVSIRHMDVSAEAFAKASQSVAENNPARLGGGRPVAGRAARASNPHRIRTTGGGVALVG